MDQPIDFSLGITPIGGSAFSKKNENVIFHLISTIQLHTIVPTISGGINHFPPYWTAH
jgi:hypothetical protein